MVRWGKQIQKEIRAIQRERRLDRCPSRERGQIRLVGDQDREISVQVMQDQGPSAGANGADYREWMSWPRAQSAWLPSSQS